jgi:hypothetical protein
MNRRSGHPQARLALDWDHVAPATVGGRVGDAPSARAASLASSAALSFLPWPPLARRLDPYVIPYVNPYVIPYALGVRTPGLGGRAHLSSQSPSGG